MNAAVGSSSPLNISSNISTDAVNVTSAGSSEAYTLPPLITIDPHSQFRISLNLQKMYSTSFLLMLRRHRQLHLT